MRNRAAEAYCKDSYDAFMEDVYIWERKLYRPEPVLCAGDCPSAKLRRWHQQFYTDRAEVDYDAFPSENRHWTVEELRDRQRRPEEHTAEHQARGHPLCRPLPETK